MKVLNFAKAAGGQFVASEGLDALWERAEQIGRVSLGRQLFGGHPYEAEIHYRMPSGTTVFAKGVDDDRHEALRKAIKEAERLLGQ